MITSTSNEKVKNVIKCVKQAKERRRQGVFVVEGVRMFAELPRKLLVETLVTEQFFEKNAALFDGVEYELVSEHVMEAVSDTKTPQGVVSLVQRLEYTVEQVCGAEDTGSGAEASCAAEDTGRGAEASCAAEDTGRGAEALTAAEKSSASVRQAENPLIIALEDIQDPGNLGTIVRTAEGAGVTGIIMSNNTVDIYNPKVVRSTMGSIFRVPFCYVGNLTEVIGKLSDQGFSTYGAHLQGTSFYDYNYTKPTIFVLGNEGKGLTDEMAGATRYKIRIPMKGRVESLNVATASTVLMYEAMRQRNS